MYIFSDAGVTLGSEVRPNEAEEGEHRRREGPGETGDGLAPVDGLELESGLQLIREIAFNGAGKMEEHEENFQSSDKMMTF